MKKVVEKIKRSRWVRRFQPESFKEEEKRKIIPENTIDHLLLNTQFLREPPANEKKEEESKNKNEPKDVNEETEMRQNLRRCCSNANIISKRQKESQAIKSSIWNALFSFKISSKDL